MFSKIFSKRKTYKSPPFKDSYMWPVNEWESNFKQVLATIPIDFPVSYHRLLTRLINDVVPVDGGVVYLGYLSKLIWTLPKVEDGSYDLTSVYAWIDYSYNDTDRGNQIIKLFEAVVPRLVLVMGNAYNFEPAYSSIADFMITTWGELRTMGRREDALSCLEKLSMQIQPYIESGTQLEAAPKAVYDGIKTFLDEVLRRMPPEHISEVLNMYIGIGLDELAMFIQEKQKKTKK